VLEGVEVVRGWRAVLMVFMPISYYSTSQCFRSGEAYSFPVRIVDKGQVGCKAEWTQLAWLHTEVVYLPEDDQLSRY